MQLESFYFSLLNYYIFLFFKTLGIPFPINYYSCSARIGTGPQHVCWMLAGKEDTLVSISQNYGKWSCLARWGSCGQLPLGRWFSSTNRNTRMENPFSEEGRPGSHWVSIRPTPPSPLHSCLGALGLAAALALTSLPSKCLMESPRFSLKCPYWSPSLTLQYATTLSSYPCAPSYSALCICFFSPQHLSCSNTNGISYLFTVLLISPPSPVLTQKLCRGKDAPCTPEQCQAERGKSVRLCWVNKCAQSFLSKGGPGGKQERWPFCLYRWTGRQQRGQLGVF